MDAPGPNWSLFDEVWGGRVAEADAAWAAGLTPEARLAVVDDLFATVRAARLAGGDWPAVDERAWRETLDERLAAVQAFRSLDEARRGTAAPRDPR